MLSRIAGTTTTWTALTMISQVASTPTTWTALVMISQVASGKLAINISKGSHSTRWMALQGILRTRCRKINKSLATISLQVWASKNLIPRQDLPGLRYVADVDLAVSSGWQL